MHAGGTIDDTRLALAAAREDRPDAVVAVGGDGTLRLAAEALHGAGIPLGLVPVGTGNDFATALRLARDPASAADLILDGPERAIDVARATRADGTSSLFTTIFASGFDAKVNERANRMRWPQGRARYNIAILLEFALLSPIAARLEWTDADGATGGHDGPVLLVAAANTTTYGGGVPIAPDADPADGLLDLVIVHPASRFALVRILALAFSGRHTSFPQVEIRRVRRVRIDAPGLTGYADGDPMGALPIELDVLPASLVLRAPAPAVI